MRGDFSLFADAFAHIMDGGQDDGGQDVSEVTTLMANITSSIERVLKYTMNVPGDILNVSELMMILRN